MTHHKDTNIFIPGCTYRTRVGGQRITASTVEELSRKMKTATGSEYAFPEYMFHVKHY